ncbi:hypothetical protein Y032_0235g3201 [Ancylostoma ceylanicum]|uniref:Uncharacterized protein n=1 Tax=Ancylostoma ceylanicum TaxID=53326 RepID=A0A016SF25_9BILA|nr:hypothetical protein Y032_0235g3201 [Ancylostoma ceylanicum]
MLPDERISEGTWIGEAMEERNPPHASTVSTARVSRSHSPNQLNKEQGRKSEKLSKQSYSNDKPFAVTGELVLVAAVRLHETFPVQYVRRIRRVQNPLAMQLNKCLGHRNVGKRCRTCSATRSELAPSHEGARSSSHVELRSSMG